MGAVREFRNRCFQALLSKPTILKHVLRNLPERFQDIHIHYDDHKLIVNPKTSFGLETAQRGLFHRTKIKAIQALVPAKAQTGTVLELGSNVGTETVSLLLEGYDRVICVEPDPSHIVSLQRNIDINGFGDRTTIVNAAVGDVETTGHLNRSALHPSANSLVWEGRADSSLEVSIHTVSTILGHAKVTPEDIALIWMDVEGFELKAFQSMGVLCQQKTPIFFEYTGGEVDGNLIHSAADVQQFIDMASEHYDHCYVMEINGNTLKKIAFDDILAIQRQVDLLLF